MASLERASAGAERSTPDSAGPAVRLEHVTRVFGVVPGVVRVDLTVLRGDAVLVRGPNGSGKTTLLRLIATAISPTYGGGRVLGHDLVREREAIRARTELMGHRGRFYLDLTGEENLSFAAALDGRRPRAGEVDGVVERVGLGAAGRDRVRTYSQGMRQRLAVARVLLRKPELLLLDEPYAGLDVDGRTLVNALLDEARLDGRTVLIATHEPVPPGAVARTVSMEAGRIADGAVEELVGGELEGAVK